MERLLELLLKQSLAEGYEISKAYGQEMMARNSWKLVPALAAVKADIDKRLFSVMSSLLVLTIFQEKTSSNRVAESAGQLPITSSTSNQKSVAEPTPIQPP
jgi:hypothetical protein